MPEVPDTLTQRDTIPSWKYIALWQAWCHVRELRETILTHAWRGPSMEDLSYFPTDVTSRRTGNLQSFLLHLGLSYNSLSFKMNIRRQKWSFLKAATQKALPREKRGSMHRKEQDLPFIRALKSKGHDSPGSQATSPPGQAVLHPSTYIWPLDTCLTTRV